MSSGPVVIPESSSAASEFRRACARFATGVTVVTVADRAGQPHGLTVNSFTSVSLTPALFLVCIDKGASAEPIFQTGVHLAVNVLEEEQQSLSRRFSGAYDDRFATVEWAPGAHGAPLLSGVLATIEGKIIQRVDAGDHIILLTEARSTSYREGRPLIYFESRYQRLGDADS
jgi:flavin reductase (DIM6/NTAB) family NADH-FMN oxidoreductase RutF